MYKVFPLFVVALSLGMATPETRADDEVVGAIWHVKNKAGKEWQFRAGPKGVLWTVPKEGKPEKLGTWSSKGPDTVMNIDAPTWVDRDEADHQHRSSREKAPQMAG